MHANGACRPDPLRLRHALDDQGNLAAVSRFGCGHWQRQVRLRAIRSNSIRGEGAASLPLMNWSI